MSAYEWLDAFAVPVGRAVMLVGGFVAALALILAMLYGACLLVLNIYRWLWTGEVVWRAMVHCRVRTRLRPSGAARKRNEDGLWYPDDCEER